MSRTYFTAQAGREGKSGVKKEDEWGTTSSQSEFRAYEPAEMRNARDAPRHVKELVRNRSDHGTQPKSKKPAQLYAWYRPQEQYPDHSAVTDTEQSLPRLGSKASGSRSSGNKPLNSRAEPPKWSKTHLNPIPERGFHAMSHYNHHQLEAHLARQSHFPYRDEYAPRSKRLLYELALHKASQESVASGSTATASAYTMSQQSQRSEARSIARSQSEGSLAASSHHTADSDRVIGGVAKRRAEAQYKSPALWPPDEKWFQDKWEKEGPNGLTCANFKPGFHKRSCKMEAENLAAAPYRHPIPATGPESTGQPAGQVSR